MQFDRMAIVSKKLDKLLLLYRKKIELRLGFIDDLIYDQEMI